MEDLLWPICWTAVSKAEFLAISERGAGVGDKVIKSDIRDLVAFAQSLMRYIDKLEKDLESYDRSEVAKF